MTDEVTAMAFHEVGHAGIAWFFRHGLEPEGLALIFVGRGTRRKLVRGRFHFRGGFTSASDVANYLEAAGQEHRAKAVRNVEREILRLLGGPVAEYLAHGSIPSKAIRFQSEYRDPTSDSSRIRELLQGLTGKDDKAYQLKLQTECVEILRDPAMWAAIESLALKLAAEGAVTGIEAERIFRQLGAPVTKGW